MIGSLKHTTMKPRLSSRIFSHFVYWKSKFVIIAAIAMETGLSPKPTLVLCSTRVFAHYPLPQLLGNTAWWVDGWVHLFRMVREYVNIQIMFASQQPFTPVPFKHLVNPPLFLVQFEASRSSGVLVCAVSGAKFVTLGDIGFKDTSMTATHI